MSIELQKYKGKATRQTCPNCGRKDSFVLYIDTDTNKAIHSTVGRCNRESNCGYHYTPKQYFEANGLDTPKQNTYIKPLEPVRPMEVLPIDLVLKSASYESNFVRFLFDIFPDKSTVESLCRLYAIGATKANEVIFWQIDEFNRVRTGKIMQYEPTSGKRQYINWIHAKMIKAKQLHENFNFVQCLFGQHLLNTKPAATVAIVESEKTAIIASGLMPDFIWLAAGQLQGLNIDKCKCLAGRNIVLFPDLSIKQPNRMTAFEVWSAKAAEIMRAYKCKIIVSDLLERKATETDRQKGLDIADYLINEQRAKMPQNEIKQAISESKTAIPEPLAPEPINKKSFFDIGMDILGEQNNMTKNRLLAEMIRKYNITDTRAGKGFDLLLNNGIIEATNVDTYFLTHSTPY